MPLAAVVDSLDAVPEAIRGEYAEKDGKFYLNLEGGDNLPFVSNLKKALDSERGLNKAAKDKVAAWERLGVSPDEIESRLAEEARKAEDALKKAGKFDDILAKRLGDQKLEYDGKIGTAEKKAQAAENLARNAIMRSDLGAALVKAKASAEGMTALPKLIGDRIKIEFDEEGNANSQIMEADGRTPMVGSGKGGLATYDDLVKDVQKEFPSLFEGMGGGGGRPSNISGGSGNANLMKLSPVERMNAARAANRK